MSTATTNPSGAAAADAAAVVPAQLGPPPVMCRSEAGRMLLLVLVVGTLYALCQNGQWAPSGSDDALYLSLARDFATGQGFPHSGTGQLWPVVLAGLMKVSPSFALLNGVLAGMCLLALVMWYAVVRRFLSPWRAWCAVAAAGILFDFQRFSYTHYTEAMFFWMLAMAMLLALQVSEGRRGAWRSVAIIVLCGLMVTLRYAAGVALLPIAACLLAGQLRPRFDRQWLTLALCVVVAFAALWGSRELNRELPVAGGAVADLAAQDIMREDSITRIMLASPGEYLHRLVKGGSYVSLLLWPPASVAKGAAGAAAVKITGWLVLAICLMPAWSDFRKRQWLWTATVLYCACFMMLWPAAVGRYLAPAAPLLLAGIWRGWASLLGRLGNGALRRPALAIGCTFAAGVLLCNLAIMTVSIYVARSGNFVDAYQAGEYAELVGAADALHGRAAGDREVAVWARYGDLNRPTKGSYLLARNMILLTDRQVQIAPWAIGLRGDQALVDWAGQNGVKYLMLSCPQPPTRKWHFRDSPAGQKGNSFYRLCEVTPEGLKPISTPQPSQGIYTVPGL